MKHDNDWPQLAAGLRDLAAENAAVEPPAGLEMRVLREIASARQYAWQGDRRWLPAAGAAAVISAAALLLVHSPAAPPRRQTAKHARPFVQIPWVAPPAPYERLAVVRKDVPIAALIAAGFQVQAPDAGAALRADVLVGQDGRLLAIRLVSGLDSN